MVSIQQKQIISQMGSGKQAGGINLTLRAPLMRCQQPLRLRFDIEMTNLSPFSHTSCGDFPQYDGAGAVPLKSESFTKLVGEKA